MLHQFYKLMRLPVVIGCLSAALPGCSPSNPNLVGNPIGKPLTTNMLAANGKPMVWDCSVVQMASPPRYACGDNKTYTAFQLRDYRLGVEPPVTPGPTFEPRHGPQP